MVLINSIIGSSHTLLNSSSRLLAHPFRNFNKFKEDSTQGFNSQDQRLTPKSVKTHKSRKNRKNIFTWISKLYMICTSNVNSFSSRPLNAVASLRAQKQSTNKIGYMQAVISAGYVQIENLYRFQQHNIGRVIDYIIRAPTRSVVDRFMLIYSNNTTTLPYVRKFGGTPGENNTDHYIPVLESLNMVSGSTKTVYLTTTASTSNHSNSEPNKRKVTLLKKQAFALNHIEDQQRALKSQELGNFALDFIVCNNN
ncbi:hypothetical protein BB561_006577, partial [Smittium simulii]